ncbi:hypothetical protein H0I23_03875 [Cellulophaga sp. HaHaR_3_176]|uniref:hypothetical protein n=1 Tax=Cellulophaga sp. HaHaR_3_176 TaxID=1942464 RepID=UPI001C1FAB2F|nr:hypothetical protein [Cellulophaga sp. HaHaR_3_176]QWX84789.1 hypothetical protein H0I23_03875 [Cellulophaga sp. HaHaR_3_176]
MFKIFKKIFLYSILVLISLELLVRVFHLHDEQPVRYEGEKGIEKWVPNQTEYSVTGNRKQNVGKYRINNFGFNSVHDDYNPTDDDFEIAIVGDSFIEGFHEDYTNSLGQQIEKGIETGKVLEFGYAGYDLADELFLLTTYNEIFEKIDHTYIYLRYTDDLERDHHVLSSRLSLDSPLSRFAKKIKLLVYLKEIGALDPVLKIPERIKNFTSNTIEKVESEQELMERTRQEDAFRLQNFKKLLDLYPVNKDKYTFLFDSSLCSKEFLVYLKDNNYRTLDINTVFKNSEKPTTLIYDQHWSEHGRKLMANLLIDDIKSMKYSK